MLSSLPPELLREITESTVPHTYHSTTYKERQADLRSLCLVSRQFRQIAQPLLFKIVQLNGRQIQKFAQNQESLTTRVLVLTGKLDHITPVLFESVLIGCQNLQSLVINRYSELPLDLECLSRCANLINLKLSGPGFHFNPCIRPLSLRSLTFDVRAVPTIGQILDPTSLPSLRTLGFRGMVDASNLEALRATRVSHLLPRLEAIVVGIVFFNAARDNLLASFTSRTLVTFIEWDLDDGTLDLSTVHHIKFALPVTVHLDKERSHVSKVVSKLLSRLHGTKPGPLRSIYLPSSFRPSSFDSAKSRQILSRLEAECVRQGVNLVLEECRLKDWTDPFLSDEFSRRQREQREAGQVGK